VLFNDVPCKFCYKSVCPQGHHLCLRGVAPERVVAAAQTFLAARSWAPASVEEMLPSAEAANAQGVSEAIG